MSLGEIVAVLLLGASILALIPPIVGVLSWPGKYNPERCCEQCPGYQGDHHEHCGNGLPVIHGFEPTGIDSADSDPIDPEEIRSQ